MKPCVLVFAGSDPSGGAGISADIEAIAAQGAHALPIITAITVQDNDRVFAVHPVAADLILQQAQTLTNKMPISAIKIGIIASQTNAAALAGWITAIKKQYPNLPVILDPVLASGHGDALAVEDPLASISPLLNIATLITPNLPEAAKLCPDAKSALQQARHLMQFGATDILIKGGHSTDANITNSWFHGEENRDWQWPRLAGAFHGSGCTLASAIAGQLACGASMQQALEAAQTYCHQTLEHAYAIAPGQLIPNRTFIPNSP
ncbi:bifunctional hydroxymethylpyrimidine kinase/phosphomethylpyrimidine kinase [Solimicrobium silvestre]|uniref:hydroxymethylpyrimidine kinase n=1 Tax=Solimicrobium silvestre TaxID=2099400 RepID=A0A2S9GV56_9BURK|nr:hydroxymethylpyrimidine/phosphomethylpyrimidine kinase [Solimicrobium silvestre]PRC91607.1 Hydroxymethylpyrimidine/phosphomethylpyrimidine kinase [Solimicrobium silvestre]